LGQRQHRLQRRRSLPTGPIKRGGITDKWLADYSNLIGDTSANSGNNAFTRDPAFTKDFLKRHQDKLIFGSDCPCLDGHGKRASENSYNKWTMRTAGKCIAFETLTVMKNATTPEIFRKIAWENSTRILRIKA
jgi:predicted TIM-barrel fold metal-dependent hydrolase